MLDGAKRRGTPYSPYYIRPPNDFCNAVLLHMKGCLPAIKARLSFRYFRMKKPLGKLDTYINKISSRIKISTVQGRQTIYIYIVEPRCYSMDVEALNLGITKYRQIDKVQTYVVPQGRQQHVPPRLAPLAAF